MDIARHAGVSSATVSRVMNGTARVRRETRERVDAAISALGYHPNLISRQLRRGKAGMLMVLVSNISNPFCTTTLHGIEEEAERAGYNLLVCNSESSPAREKANIALLQGGVVDGIITMDSVVRISAIHEMVAGLPWVQLAEHGNSERDIFVSIDNRRALEAAILHLLARGSTRIALVSTGDAYHYAREREAAYLDTLAAQGLSYRLIHHVADASSYALGAEAFHRIFSRSVKPDAVITVSDVLAIGVLAAAHARGVAVPDDLAVVGFDGIAQSAFTIPPLTTITQPMHRMGREAGRMIVERIAGKAVQSVYLECELTIRHST